MTSGIYKLVFPNTDKVYVGRSKNVEIRYKQHLACFRGNTSSKKLQEAYNTYGTPNSLLITEGPEDSLIDLENSLIKELDCVNNGFNSRGNTDGGHSGLWGDLNGRSKYTNEQIADCLFLLIQIPKLTYPIISSRTGVPKATIVDIANSTGHTWLEKFFPEEIKELKSFRHKRNTRLYLNAVSPEGIVYKVEHLSDFCKEHGLQTGNMSRLLRGKCKSHGKWTAIAEEI